MKQSILLIVLLFFMKPVFPILDFVINYDAIQELCINKDKPELQCNGTCHLKKELAKTAEDENPFATKITFQLHTDILFFTTIESINFDLPAISYSTEIVDRYHAKYAYHPTFELIKPPLA